MYQAIAAHAISSYPATTVRSCGEPVLGIALKDLFDELARS